MRSRPLAVLAAAAVAVPTIAAARLVMRDPFIQPEFQLHGMPLGGSDRESARETPAYLASSRIATLGDGALVSDADSGKLIATDAKDRKRAELPIGRNAGLLAYDPIAQRAYVADRQGDRIVAVSTAGGKLTYIRVWSTPAEPYGVALTPDRATLLVTTIADRTLVAYATDTGKERWRTPVGAEPRGLAISPDGTRAIVASLTTGAATTIDLTETHLATNLALSTAFPTTRSTEDVFARGSFSALFMGSDQAVIPFQRETPVQQADGSENVGSYGGGAGPPLKQQLAFIGFSSSVTRQVIATVAVHQPRAMAWDRARDRLYVAGFGSDTILHLDHATTSSITFGGTFDVNPIRPTLGDACGPDGLAIAPNGSVLVWCAFTRRVSRVDIDKPADRVRGPELAASAYTDKQHLGMVLFHQSNAAISERGSLACASCHPDNRTDGLSWRIEKHTLQTPVLAGRVAGTHPFKWDGTDKDLTASLGGTMKRLGGHGLTKQHIRALSAYVEALPAPRTPTRSVDTVARGEKLFASEGCRGCHAGTKYTDRAQHAMSPTLAKSDTPSLIGLTASAPYYHDGSAATLESLLRGRGNVHGMVDATDLSDGQVADLVAFLETL